MDLEIFRAINNLAGRWLLLDQLAIFLATYAGVIMAMVVVGLLIARKEYRQMAMVALVSALISRYFFVTLIRLWYQRPRPISVDAMHQLVVNTQWAFPSGHASFFFALSTGVYLYHKKLGVVFYIVSILMGISRIFIGVHWPTDILAGVVLGILVALGVESIAQKLERPRQTGA